jgi:hypothetical protein
LDLHFNEQFNVSAIEMRKLGVFNPKMGHDNKMFVDPKLLENAADELLGARSDLLDYFAGTVSLIKMIRTKTDADIYWVRAWQRMRFKETSNTCLGSSRKGTDGNGIGPVLAKRIVNRAADILPHVKFQPDLFELIGVFADGLGCDRVSDMIVSILKLRFIAYTNRITRALGIQRTVVLEIGSQRFAFPCLSKGDKPIILIPKRILKPLPIAMSIEEALLNADLNDHARREVNKAFSDAHKLGTRPKAESLRAIIRTDSSIAAGILSAYQRAKGVPYDFDTAPVKVTDFEPIARELVGTPKIHKSGLDPWERVEACVRDTIDNLRQSIEENRLSDVLFDNNDAPREEIISQRIIFAVANIFARLYDVDASREGNAGPGAVDFRFTVGFNARLLVETKLSTHAR